jgi:hypothetical protein
MRPPEAPPVTWASTAERDTAKQILEALRVARGSFGDQSWALLMNQINELTKPREGVA